MCCFSPCTCLLLKRDPVSLLPPSRPVRVVTAEPRLFQVSGGRAVGSRLARVWDYGATVNFHTKTSEKKKYYLYLVTIPLRSLKIKALAGTRRTSAFRFYPPHLFFSAPLRLICQLQDVTWWSQHNFLTSLTAGSSRDFSCNVIFVNAAVSLCLPETKQKEILT